jgi:hypothetical protein
MFCTPHQYHSGDQVKKKEMDGACGTCGGEERCACSANLKERGLFETLGVAGRVILKWM